MAVNTSYKVYNGSEFVEYYFKTSAGLVGVTSTRKFITSSTKVNNKSFTLASSGEGATLTLDGSEIENGIPSGSYNYISGGAPISVSLQLLDAGVKQAYDHVPSNCLTYGQNGNFQTQFECLNQLESFAEENYLGGDVGFIRIKATNNNDIFFELDDTVYAPAGRTVNGKALTSNVVLYSTDIAMSSSDNTTLKAELDNIREVAEGKTNTYAISVTGGTSSNLNSQFNSTADMLEVIVSGSNKYIAQIGSLPAVDITTLKIGDVILTSTQDTADWWYSGEHYTVTGRGTAYVFYKMAMESVELTFSALQSHPTTLGGYGITDAKIENGVITLGSNTIQPLTSHQSLASVVPYSGATGDVNLGNHKLYADEVIGTDNMMTDVSFTLRNIGSIYQDGGSDNMYIEINKYNNQYIGDVVVRALNMTFNGKNVATISVGTTAPTSPRVGDVWLDTNN